MVTRVFSNLWDSSGSRSHNVLSPFEFMFWFFAFNIRYYHFLILHVIISSGQKSKRAIPQSPKAVFSAVDALIYLININYSQSRWISAFQILKVWKQIGWVSKLGNTNPPFWTWLISSHSRLCGQDTDDNTCWLVCSGTCPCVAESPTREMMMTKKRPPGNGVAEPGRKGCGRSKRKNPWGRWLTRWRLIPRTGTVLVSMRRLWVCLGLPCWMEFASKLFSSLRPTQPLWFGWLVLVVLR